MLDKFLSCRRCRHTDFGSYVIISSYQNRTFYTNHTSSPDHFQVFDTWNAVFKKKMAPTSYSIIKDTSIVTNEL